jgi:hypothetical protein
LRVRACDLQPGDVVRYSNDVVERVSVGKMTPHGWVDVWFERRHACWRKHRKVELERRGDEAKVT